METPAHTAAEHIDTDADTPSALSSQEPATVAVDALEALAKRRQHNPWSGVVASMLRDGNY